MRAYTLLLLAVMIGLNACTTTRMTAMTNKVYSSESVFHKLLFVGSGDLQIHDRSLRAFSARLKTGSTTEVVSAYDIFFPKKSYTTKEILAELNKNAIDGIVLLNVGDQKSQELGFVMPVLNTSYGSVTGRVGSANVNLTTTQTHTANIWVPYNVYNTRSEMVLIDPKKRDIVWTASANTESLDLDSIYASIARSGAIKLMKAGLVEPRYIKK